ncbi:hypothetical protein MKEN_00939600 [Mycena kentingensis (nom. inval.)]|nr:hypothetical protein MKEN_00939600 [Mycena kentingensis (nom. inval.)]
MAKRKAAPTNLSPPPSKEPKVSLCFGEYDNRHKWCYCDPNCEKSLRLRQRQDHYADAEHPDDIPPSVTDSHCSCTRRHPDDLPLRTPAAAWNPSKLPSRSEDSFNKAEAKLDEAAADGKKTYRRQLVTHYGIKGPPVLRRVGSLDRPGSYPWDIMHLFFENVIPALVKLWSGKFPGVNTRLQPFFLSETTWREIWAETSAAVGTIPSQFARSLAGAPNKFTAEAWCFWFLYLAPALLKGRLADPYHTHMRELGRIIRICMQLSYTREELERLRRTSPVCILSIHGMLHIVDDILFCGPCWMTWTFFVERYCGFLKRGLTNKRFPWANMNQRVLNFAHLAQLSLLYDLKEELALFRPPRGLELSRFEVMYENEYPKHILRAPRWTNYALPDDITPRLVNYLAKTLRAKKSDLRPLLPQTFTRWAKMRLTDGDAIRVAHILRRGDENQRDNSYVRFTRPGDDESVAYGRLDDIFEAQLPRSPNLKQFSNKRRIFALITPCHTQNRNAALELVGYNSMEEQMIVDLAAIWGVVGRLRTGGRWYIVDRIPGSFKPEMVPHAEEDEIEGEGDPWD